MRNKFKWLVAVLLLVLSLGVFAACGDKEEEPTPTQYTVTFVANGVTVDTVQYDEGATSVAEPTVPAKEHYTGAWESYTLNNADITVNAVYTPIDYTITFAWMDSEVTLTTTSGTYTVESTSVQLPTVPAKDGWKVVWTYSKGEGSSAVSGDWEDYDFTEGGAVTVTGHYEFVGYSATFLDWDGSEYHSDHLDQLPANVNKPQEDPERDPSNTIVYTFEGWYRDGDVAESLVTFPVEIDHSVVYRAKYSETTRLYSVSFVDEDNSPLRSKDTYQYNEALDAPETDPIKNPTARYTYTFAGWIVNDGDTPIATADLPATVTASVVYKAFYTQADRMYTVTFYTYDHQVIETQQYKYEETVVPPAVPARDPDVQYTYTPHGWTPEIVAVVANAEYTAQYTTTTNKYTIIFLDWDGHKFKEETLDYGTTVTAPTPDRRPSTSLFTITFEGWDSTVVSVVGNATYTATYSVVAKSGYAAHNAEENGNDGVTLKAGSYTGSDPRIASDVGDVEQSYFVLKGNYTMDDFLTIEFTGKNMPEVAFFSNGANNYSMYGDGANGQGVVVVTGLTDNKGNTVKLDTSKATTAQVGFGFPFMMQDASNGGFIRDAFKNDYQIGRNMLDDNTHYRVVMGFEGMGDYQGGAAGNTNAITLFWALYDLDEDKIVEQKSITSWGYLKSSPAQSEIEAGMLKGKTVSELIGDIVLYGKFGVDVKINKLEGVAKANGVIADKGGVILTQGSYTGSEQWSGGSSVNQSYLGFDKEGGSYSYKDYLVLDFTGKNMPEVAFFAKNYNNSMYKADNKTGIVVLTGVTNMNGTDVNIRNGSPAAGTYIQYDFPNMVSNIGSNGFVSGGFPTTNLGRANLVDGKHYRVIMGFEKSGASAIVLNWALYDRDTGELVENPMSLTSYNFFTGANSQVDNMTQDDLKGSIVLYGKFGVSCIIDKVQIVNGDFNTLVTNYKPN